MQDAFRIIQHGNSMFFYVHNSNFLFLVQSSGISPALQTHMFVTTATDSMRFIRSYLPYSPKLIMICWWTYLMHLTYLTYCTLLTVISLGAGR